MRHVLLNELQQCEAIYYCNSCVCINSISNSNSKIPNLTVSIQYLGHFRGMAYPSRPGFRGMLEMVLRQERHWMVMLVAFARIAEALIIIPGIFTSFAICSD